MRKLVIGLIAGVLGSAILAPAVSAAPWAGDGKKACADVIDGRATYRSVSDGTGEIGSEVLAQMDLGTWACKNVTYTLTVLDSETNSTVLETAEGVPNRPTDDPNVSPQVEFVTKAPYTGPTGDVCLVVTTTKKNGQVLDTAPDTGCISYTIDSDVTGFQKWR